VTIKTFIETQYGEATGRVSLWWREKPGAKSPIDKQKWFTYPAELDAMASFAESKANKDLYLTVGAYSEDKRTPDNVTLISAIYQDTDTFDYTQYRIEPSTVVHTSPGKTHCWFTLDRAYDASQVELITKKMTYAHRAAGNDVSSWGRNKVLRVPGSVNTNYDGFPEDVTVEYTGAVYTLQEIANAYDDVALPTAAPKVAPMSRVEVQAPTAELPTFLNAQSKLPATFPLELITQEPSAENRSQMREKLILECMRAGLSDMDAASIAWNSKCGAKYHEGREDLLWYEIAKFRAIIEDETGEHAEPPAPEERKVVNPKAPVTILSKPQRERALAHWDRTFLGEYERYVRESIKIFNGPYHRAVGWTILTAVVGECGKIRQGKRDLPLNLYIMPIGGTTTGKSEAMALGSDVIHGSFSVEENPDIGDDTSQSALSQKLHKRDGKVTLVNSDEADGLIESLTDKGSWKPGLLSFYTRLYDGLVPPIMRTGDVDGKWSKTIFSMFLMGTEAGMVGALTRKMFETGFLTRFAWFIGENIEVPEESLGVREGSIEQAMEDRSQIEAWSSNWNRIREDWMFRRMTGGGEYIRFDSPETAEFFQKVTAKLEHSMFRNHRNADIIKPSVIRLNRTMWKMSALLAVSSGRYTISMDDILVSLLQGEELLGNLIYMAGVISDSAHAKSVDELETYLNGQPERKARVERIYRRFASATKVEVDVWLANLCAQGRAGSERDAVDGAMIYKLKGEL